MSHTASNLFSALPTNQADAWKPVNAAAGKSGKGKSLVATAFSAPSAADSVDVSPLAKALTGSAAKLFEKLDGKARSMLEDSVKAGVLTADDVVNGLRGIAKETVQLRYFKEAPRTQEEIEYGEKMRAISDRRIKFGQEHLGIMASFSKQMEQADTELSGKELPVREQELVMKEQAALAEHKKNFIKQYGDPDEKVMKDGKEYDPNSMMLRLSNNFRHSDLFSDENDTTVISPAESKAVEKLFNAGFRPGLYGKAAAAYAQDVDLSRVPDLATPEAAPKPTQASPDKPAPAQSDDNAQLTAGWQAAAAMATFGKDAEEDPTVVLLRANANATAGRQGYPALQPSPAAPQTTADGSIATADNEDILGALTHSLKTGTAAVTATGAARTDTKV